MQSKLAARDLVLIGAGHTNLHIVRMWRMQPIPDVQLTLVSAFSRATYSGMLPGTLAGLYGPEAMEIDLYRFSESCGVRLIAEEAIGFDPNDRRVLFANRPPLRYDVASIGIGSIPNAREVWDAHPEILSLKPMPTFRQRFEARLNVVFSYRSADADTPINVYVIGAGAGGVEVTFCLDVLAKRRGINARLGLIDSGDNVLRGSAAKAVQLVRNECDRRGIAITTGERVTGFQNGELQLRGGKTLPADIVIWATGAAPPPWLDNFDLPRADDGFLAVRPTLQTTADHRVFVVGDTATLIDNPVRKAGVYAVREDPVLWENIQRLFNDRPLVPYEPQSGFLSLLSTGDGRAIVEYKGFSTHGRWAGKLKDHIDRKFMRMYQDYSPMTAEMMAAQSAGNEPETPTMRCRGCGGKVGANVLSAALERLEIPPSDIVLQGLDHPDDAAVLNPNAGPVEVVSVDFFQAFMDDPYIVGRVAALNSLSDLWAMGSEPLAAMAMVTVPEGEPRQQAELLYQLLAGGVKELADAGATLLGGHTTESSDLTIGYTVMGKLGGRKPLTKANLKPGDRLILTKALGTGVLLAAHAESRCRAVWMDVMLERMLLSNRAAAHIARNINATAVTDVTGFGLASHLLEMLDASQVDAQLSLKSLPLLTGFAELSHAGVRSTLDPANRESADRMHAASSSLRDQPQYNALFDPQTSGGLLIGVTANACQTVLDQLKSAGYADVTIVGEVTSQSNSPQLSIADE